MSSKPDADGVDNLRRLLSERMELVEEITAIRSAAERLEELELKYRIVSNNVIEQLEEMDCKSNGNTGWEGRITWMLTELMRQSIERPEKKGK